MLLQHNEKGTPRRRITKYNEIIDDDGDDDTNWKHPPYWLAARQTAEFEGSRYGRQK